MIVIVYQRRFFLDCSKYIFSISRSTNHNESLLIRIPSLWGHCDWIQESSVLCIYRPGTRPPGICQYLLLLHPVCFVFVHFAFILPFLIFNFPSIPPFFSFSLYIIVFFLFPLLILPPLTYIGQYIFSHIPPPSTPPSLHWRAKTVGVVQYNCKEPSMLQTEEHCKFFAAELPVGLTFVHSSNRGLLRTPPGGCQGKIRHLDFSRIVLISYLTSGFLAIHCCEDNMRKYCSRIFNFSSLPDRAE